MSRKKNLNKYNLDNKIKLLQTCRIELRISSNPLTILVRVVSILVNFDRVLLKYLFWFLFVLIFSNLC